MSHMKTTWTEHSSFQPKLHPPSSAWSKRLQVSSYSPFCGGITGSSPSTTFPRRSARLLFSGTASPLFPSTTRTSHELLIWILMIIIVSTALISADNMQHEKKFTRVGNLPAKPFSHTASWSHGLFKNKWTWVKTGTMCWVREGYWWFRCALWLKVTITVEYFFFICLTLTVLLLLTLAIAVYPTVNLAWVFTSFLGFILVNS